MSPTGSARGRSRVMPYGMDAFMLGIGMLGKFVLIRTGRMCSTHEIANKYSCAKAAAAFKGHMVPHGEKADHLTELATLHCAALIIQTSDLKSDQKNVVKKKKSTAS